MDRDRESKSRWSEGILMPWVSAVIACCGASCAGSGDVWMVSKDQPHADVSTRPISKEAFFGMSSNTSIRKINGTGVEKPNVIYRIPPGPLRLTVENRQDTFSGYGEVAFHAKAGRSYVVKSDQAAGMKVKFWVEDQSTNAEVARTFTPLNISDEKRPKAPLVVPIFIPVN